MIPNLLQYLMAQQGRTQMTPQESALVAAAQGQQMDSMQNQQMAGAVKNSLIQNLFPPRPPNQQMQGPPQPPIDQPPIGQQPQVMPEDMLLAQNDGYGGVSAQTRVAMDQMGRADPNGEFGDAVVGKKPQAGGGGYAAKTTVRGAQSSKQEDQLVKMLIGRGMSEQEARTRAKSIK